MDRRVVKGPVCAGGDCHSEHCGRRENSTVVVLHNTVTFNQVFLLLWPDRSSLGLGLTSIAPLGSEADNRPELPQRRASYLHCPPQTPRSQPDPPTEIRLLFVAAVGPPDSPIPYPLIDSENTPQRKYSEVLATLMAIFTPTKSTWPSDILDATRRASVSRLGPGSSHSGRREIRL